MDDLWGSSSSVGILPGTQLKPTKAPELVDRFLTADFGVGSASLGGTGGSPFGL